MQELINELIAKAGLSEDAAQKSVAVTKDFIKSKVPPAFQDKIDELLEGKFDIMSLMSAFTGGNSGAGSADNSSPLDMLKGMFGNK